MRQLKQSKICGTVTATVKDLMKHIQTIHGSQPCTKFAVGKCDRNTRCWNSHSSLPNNTATQNTSNVEEQDFQDPRIISGLYSQTTASAPSVTRNTTPEYILGNTCKSRLVTAIVSAKNNRITKTVEPYFKTRQQKLTQQQKTRL